LATPYFQLRFDSVPSTQDVARESIDDLPVLVLASTQTEGRGRVGAEWLNADRALAASLAIRDRPGDERPLSLMAGVAAARVVPGARLKWPNDVLVDGTKVGGILVERSSGVSVVGVGLNLWWATAPEGMGAIYDSDPGSESHAQLGALWCAELMALVDGDGWPVDAYLNVSDTIGSDVVWEPNGSGRAVGVAPDGALIVETPQGIEHIYAGAIRHLRPG
jgi:BirA family biotin operon repressor/biotin-[acetyl-CoA-carboxylase] ligase